MATRGVRGTLLTFIIDNNHDDGELFHSLATILETEKTGAIPLVRRFSGTAWYSHWIGRCLRQAYGPAPPSARDQGGIYP